MKTFARFLTVVFLLLAPLAHGATITVNSTADPAGFNPNITIVQLGGTITLRNAMNAVRNTGGTHTITFAAALAGQTIVLSREGDSQTHVALVMGDQTTYNLTVQGLTGNNGVTIARDPNGPQMGLLLYYGPGGNTITINDLTLRGGLAPNNNWGGAISMFGNALNLNRCTFTQNQAGSLGGAINLRGGQLNISNSTLAANSCSYGQGGAIYHYGGGLSLTHTTITDNFANTGGGLFSYDGGDVLVNTIIAGNRKLFNGPDVAGNGYPSVAASSHHNLIGDASGLGGLPNGVNGNITSVNAQLNALANNGGPTATCALSTSSPAVDAGAAGFASTDQRRVSRPQGSSADIGAYELIPIAPTAFSSAADATFLIGVSNSFTVSANGAPAPNYSISGALPAGVTFNLGVLSGTPAAGTDGTYPLTITARNGSGMITQAFILTVVNPAIVTTAVDEDNGSTNPALGTGTSLREAINFANTQSTPQTITFASSLAGQTINLTITGDNSHDGPSAFPITKNITIQSLPGNNGITIRRATANPLRPFLVAFAVGATLTLNDLTIANGLAQAGGGILNYGTLRMNRCTLRDNVSTLDGGAISSYDGSSGGREVTLSNCTVVNNRARTYGGGIYQHLQDSAILTLTNVTVSGNSADAAYGTGGIDIEGNGTAINTIVAGNTKGGNPSDVGSGLNSSSHHNLIGTGGSGGLVNGVNGNIVGVADAKLASLAANGGPTQTEALLPGSPAINAGVALSGVTGDQRGLARPQGAAPDIGALEVIAPPVVTVNPQNQTVVLGGTATFDAFANYLFGGAAPNTLSGGAGLSPGQYLLSPNRAYQLLYQGDGNLVLYRGDGVALWSSGTTGLTPGHVTMQADGNLVIYGPGGVPQYVTGTSGNANAILTLQNDGNLVIYTTGGVPVFVTNTSQYAPFNPVPTAVQWKVSTDHGVTFTNIAGATGFTLSVTPALTDNGNLYRATFTNVSGILVPTAPATLTVIAPPVVTANPQNQAVPVGQTATFNALANYLYGGTAPSTLSNDAVLLPGQYLLSPGHGYQLLYQGDGNLVLYRGDGVALWNSGTAGQTPDQVKMQSDGNLVIYGPGGVAQWASSSAGNSNALLKLQDDGNLVIYTIGGVPVFATNTSQIVSLNAVPTIQWQVSTDQGVTFADIPGATGVTLSLTASVADNDNRYRAVFSNAAGTVATAPARLTISTALQVWRALQGLAAVGSQDLLTPANDGVVNLLKYAFNMAPNAGDILRPNVTVLPENGTAGLPYITRDAQGRLFVEFVRRKAATNPGITYIVETGDDLTALLSLDLSGATVVSIDGTWERVSVTDPTVTSKRFGRVRVILLP